MNEDSKAEQKDEESKAKLKLTPHTLRLLRLITTSSSDEESSRESTRQAISILSRIASSSHPIILWDILARLYTSLTLPDESDVVGGGIVRRDNVALAMEHVAKYIPFCDQRSFLVDDHVEDEAIGKIDDDDDDDDDDNENDDVKSNGRQWLRLEDFCDEENNLNPFHLMDQVLDKGRLLLSCNESRYDITSNSKTSSTEYDKESDMLAKLDASVSRKKDSEGSLSMDDFTKERIFLQRDILAKRLGLGGILSSSMVQSSSLDDIVQDEDLVETPLVASHPLNTKRSRAKNGGDGSDKMSARDRNLERMSKRKRVEEVHDGDKHGNREDDEKDDEDSSTIRTLLLLSINQYETSGKLNPNSTALLSHKTPQTLLATDLIYHSFHPSWHIRHGSLLGLRAILKSWHDSSSSLQDRGDTNDGVFGKWPQDILARCLCVLALDRFGDFSGSSLGMNSRDISNVAPVREAAAQVVALLLDMTSSKLLQESCVKILQHLNSFPGQWEVRHGAMLSLKCILELSECSPLHKRATNNALKDLICTIAPSMVERSLADDSDDVKGSCAQAISFMIQIHAVGIMNNFPITDFVVTCSKGLWRALRTLQITASCSHDLLQCLCNLVQHDCDLVLATIESSDQTSSAIADLLDKLCAVMDFPSPSMRLSCLKTLSVIVEPLARTVIKREELICGSSLHSLTFDIAKTLCRLVIKVFASFFTDVYAMEDSSRNTGNDPLEVERQTAWLSILNALNLIVSRSDKDRPEIHDRLRRTAFTVLELYFGMNNRKNHSQSWTYKVASKIQHQYHCQELAATAVISFYARVMDSVSDIDRYLTIGVLSLITSPWIEHCEMACILLRNIPNERQDLFSNILDLCKAHVWRLTNETPVCLAIDNIQNIDSVRTQITVKHVCENLWVNIVGQSNTKTFGEIDDQVTAIRRGWGAIYNKFGIDISTIDTGTKMATSLASMRLSSTIGGAVVSLGLNRLPPKLTPIIRSLITLVKNEDNAHRSGCASASLSKLITMLHLSSDEKHRTISHKLLSNICAMACVPHHSVTVPKTFTNIGCKQSRLIAQSIVEARDSQNTLEDIKPIWQRLIPLTSSNLIQCDSHVISEAISMLNCVTSSLRKGCNYIAHGTSKLLPAAIVLACTSPLLGIRQDAVESVKNFCVVDIEMALPVVLPYIKLCATSMNDDPKRLGSCVLLNTIVRNVGVRLCPYIRYLLPISMPGMTDPLKQCADLSSSTFSLLVRLAPLVDTRSEHSDSLLLQKNENSQRVMDHLIYGKPLPPCLLPPRIVSTLKESGIVLRDYQVEGISWIQFLRSVRLNGALCDDMGLGKTLQALVGIAITHHELAEMDEKTKPKSLIVCPSSVTGQWTNEIKKIGFGNAILNVMQYTGATRKKDWDNMLEGCDLVITSYPVLRSDITILGSVSWTYCVLDEGHLLKNPKTLTAKSARKLKSQHKLILSGTPVQNKVHELWSAFDWLMPNYLGSDKEFSATYARLISKGNLPGASSREIRDGMEKLKQLHQQVLPFILRRQKSDVLKELPPKTIIDIPCAMTETQKCAYSNYSGQKYVQDAMAVLNRFIQEDSERFESADASHRQPLDRNVFKSLLSLRLVCTHPILVSKYSNNSESRFDISGKLLALNDLLRRAQIVKDEITAADNDESLLYLDGQDTGVPQVDILAEDNGDIFEEGDVNDDTTNHSKCLIFAQFTKSLDVVENLVLKPLMPSLRYVRIDGRTDAKHRAKIVDAFQSDDSIRCMLLTSKIGSLGLNLQAADTVIFLENDWNPFVDLQAMDRSHRIGQQHHVKVYRLITEGSIEEDIMAMQKVKIAMSNAIVNTDNSTLFSMGTDRLLDLFTTNDG